MKKKKRKLTTKIKVYRAMKDLTQEELAQLVGVTRETISYIERGKYSPSLRVAYEIAEVLETTLDELFSYE